MVTGSPLYLCFFATSRFAVDSNCRQLPHDGSLIALISPARGLVQAIFTWRMKCSAKASAPALLWALAAGGRGAAVGVAVVEEGGVGFTDEAVGVGTVLVGAEELAGLHVPEG